MLHNTVFLETNELGAMNDFNTEWYHIFMYMLQFDISATCCHCMCIHQTVAVEKQQRIMPWHF